MCFWKNILELNLLENKHKLNMKKLVNPLIENKDYLITDETSYSNIYLNVSLNRLLDLLGNPSIIGSGDNKVQIEWVYYKSKDIAFTIYDYKSNALIHNIRNWHVGSKNLKLEQIISELKNLGFEDSEIKVNK